MACRPRAAISSLEGSAAALAHRHRLGAVTGLEADSREHVVQPLAVGRADVDRETDTARDHVARAGLDVELAHGRHGSLDLQGRVADAEDLGGRLDERVLAVLHRRRSGMAGAAFEPELAARVADDARDDAERHARPLERRPLLDVELEERRRHLLVAAERAAADAADLLAAKGHDRAAARLLDGLDRGDDAERAVELPSLRHGVEMGADPDVVAACRSDRAGCRVRRPRPPARPRAASPPPARAQRPPPRSDAAGSRPARRRSRTAPPGARTCASTRATHLEPERDSPAACRCPTTTLFVSR